MQCYGINDIQLDDWITFEEMLVSLGVCEELTVTHAANAVRAAEVMRNTLERAEANSRKTFPLSDLSKESALTAALNGLLDAQSLQYIYPSNDPRRRLQNRVQDILNNRLPEVFQQKWKPIADLFAPGRSKRRLFGIVQDLMGTAGANAPRPVVVIDLSARGNQGRFWTEELQRRILGKLLRASKSTCCHG